MKYVAHKTENEVQSVKEHLEGTATLSASFADAFGAGELGRLCGLAHDIGKYSDGFQNYIQSLGGLKKEGDSGFLRAAE